MTNALLLDTHIALWLDSGDTRLRAQQQEIIGGTETGVLQDAQ